MSTDNRLLPLPTAELERATQGGALQSPGYYGASYSNSDQAQLREYLSIIFKRKWMILLIAVVVTTLVAIYMIRQPSMYEAETLIRIERKSNSLIQTKDIVINTSNAAEYWNTQIRLLENPKLLRQVVLALDLPNNPRFLDPRAKQSFFASVRRAFSRGGDEAAAKQETLPVVANAPTITPNASAAAANQELSQEEIARLEPYEATLKSGLKIEPYERTNLVLIKFRHPDPATAALVADALVRVFINNDVQNETQGTQNAINNIGRQIVDLQQTIRQQEEQRMSYLKAKNLPTSEITGSNLTAVQLGTYSSQLLEAENTRKRLQSAVEAADHSPDVWSVPEVQTNKQIQDLRVRVSGLEERRKQLLVDFTPEWPEVKQVDEQVVELRRQLERDAREIVTSLRSQLRAARAWENKLKTSYSGARVEANQMSQSAIYLNSLNQQIDTNKKLYDTLFQRQQELEVNASDRVPNVGVANPARIPTVPVGPARALATGIAFLLSLGVGIALAIMLELLDDSLNTVEDVDRYIQLPTLALIPTAKNERSKLLPAKNGKAPVAPVLLTFTEDVHSPINEAFRHLRTSLIFSSAGQPPKSILVTSGQPSEGKSTVAANTAIALAQTGAQVLLLDCDLRRPRVHAMFGLSNAVGVINHLSGNSDIKSIIQRYEQVPTLSVITTGPVPPNPAELLGSPQMAKMLNELSEHYTHIVIDSPPVVSFTDAAILSTLVDGVMLVTHGGKSSRAVVKRAKKLLNDVGARIYGIVLNNVKLRTHGYYYYGGYNYADYYASEEHEEVNVAQ